MGKRNKKKDIFKDKKHELKWEDISIAREHIVNQIVSQIKLVDVVRRFKQEELFDLNRSKIDEAINEHLNKLPSKPSDDELLKIQTEIMKPFISLTDEEELILKGYLNGLDDILKRVYIVTKNHATMVEKDDKVEINFKKGKVVGNVNFNVYTECFIEYVQIEDDVVDFIKKSLVEISNIVSDQSDFKKTLFKLIDEINQYTENTTEKGEEDGKQ